MDVAWLTLGALLMALGFIGCFVPVLPGPVAAFCGLVCLVPTAAAPSVGALAAFGAVTALAVALDYVVPAMGAKRFQCSRWGVCGCLVGTLAGVFFFPVGLVAGPFLGALAGELVAGKRLAAAVRGGIGALLGFLAGTMIKTAVCGAMAVYFFAAIRR